MDNKKGLGLADPKPTNSNLQAAIAYASLLGFNIFPIYYKGKAPITQHGFKDATNDIKQIKTWWELFPNAGIGLPTGSINNIVVLDIDPRNGGNFSFERLVDENENLPHTVHCETGGGGFHLYFNYDKRIKRNSLIDYPGIDVQSDGKYVILPPSTHPNGRDYEWEQSSKPVVTPIADPPSWLVNKLRVKTKTGFETRETSDYLNILNGVNDGERNNSMMTLIGHLLAKNIDYRIAYELVKLWNERNNPPLSDKKVTRAFNNILRLEANKRKTRRG